MKTLQDQLFFYGSYHTHPKNKLTHYIGVPIIIIALFMALDWIHINIAGLFNISFSWLLVIGVLIYYFRLNIKLAILSAIIFIPSVYLITLFTPFPPGRLGLYLFVVLFVGGWILQLVGHIFEGKNPALLSSFSQVFIAPLFFILEILDAIGLKKYFLPD